jgi:hypothetical protein
MSKVAKGGFFGDKKNLASLWFTRGEATILRAYLAPYVYRGKERVTKPAFCHLTFEMQPGPDTGFSEIVTTSYTIGFLDQVCPGIRVGDDYMPINLSANVAANDTKMQGLFLVSGPKNTGEPSIGFDAKALMERLFEFPDWTDRTEGDEVSNVNKVFKGARFYFENEEETYTRTNPETKAKEEKKYNRLMPQEFFGFVDEKEVKETSPEGALIGLLNKLAPVPVEGLTTLLMEKAPKMGIDPKVVEYGIQVISSAWLANHAEIENDQLTAAK